MPEIDSTNEVILDGMRFRTRGPIPDSNLAVFQGKITLGDFTQDSNPLLSSWVMSDFSGGVGVEDMNESMDTTRYWTGTLYTRYPRQISKNYKINTFPQNGAWAASGRPRFLGDFYAGNWVAMFALDNKLYTLDAPGTLRGTLTSAPVGKSVMFQGTAASPFFVIPMGASGVAHLSTGYILNNTAASATCPAAISLMVWDNKLVAVDTAGQLWYTTDVSGSWTSYGATAKLPTGAVPRSLVPYFDRQGTPAIFVVTDTEVWQFNPTGPELFTVDVFFPPHPYHGLAATRWDGDLYFSVGQGVHRYTGGSLAAMGLDSDDGLPGEFAGNIVAGGLVPGYNALYAFVDPTGQGSWSGGFYSSIFEWTGSGWHPIYATGGEFGFGSDIVDYGMGISRHGSNYRLYWGEYWGSSGNYFLKYIDLPVSYSNPRARVPFDTFQPGGYLITPIFDANMTGYRKTAHALDIRIEQIDPAAELNVYYEIDDAIDGGFPSTWLGTIHGVAGRSILPFGTSIGGPLYSGMDLERIQFHFQLTDATSTAFIMNSAVFSFLKRMPSSYSWTLELDMTANGPGNDSPQAMKDKIDAIINTGLFVPMVHRGATYRVFVSQSSGSSETGIDERGFRRVSVLEIPDSLG